MKLICWSFLWTIDSILLLSLLHLKSVTAKSCSFSVGQQVIILCSFSVHCSLKSALSFISVSTGRRSVMISLGRWTLSSISPARNWKTSCHLPFLMFSETKFLNSVSLILFAKCLAAKNSCIVRWMKQNCRSYLSALVLRSGKRWKSALSSIPRTSFPSRISFPSLIPSNATLPSFSNFSSTSEGNSSVSKCSRVKSVSCNSLVCLK